MYFISFILLPLTLKSETIEAAPRYKHRVPFYIQILTRAKAEYHLMSTCSNLLRENLSAEEVTAYSSHSAVTVCKYDIIVID